MSNLALIGLPAYDLSSPTIGPSEVGTMPKSYLSTLEPWQACRINDSDPRLTYIDAPLAMPNSYYGPTMYVGGVGIVNHNLSLSATVRTILLGSTGAGYQPSRVLPTSKTDTLGTWSDAYTDVDDDPYSIDGTKNSTTDADAAVTYEMATPGATATTGTNLQSFRIAVSYSAAIATFSVSLITGTGPYIVTPVYISATGANPLPATGAVVVCPWTLGAEDPATVQVKISITGNTGTFSVEAVDWLADTELSAGSILADTGWQVATMDRYDATWGATVNGTVGVAPQQTLAQVFSSNITGVTRAVTWFRDPLNTAGYIDVGRYVVGPQFVPGLNRDWGTLVKLKERDTVNEGEGGSSWGVRREPIRTMPVPLSWLTPAEGHSLFERLWRAGSLTPFVASIFPNDATEQFHTSLYVRASSLPDLSAAMLDYRAMTFELTEKL